MGCIQLTYPDPETEPWMIFVSYQIINSTCAGFNRRHRLRHCVAILYCHDVQHTEFPGGYGYADGRSHLVMYAFPPEYPVSGGNMNYVCIVYFITFTLIIAWWFIDARTNFHLS
ncbi:hypothetical protein ASPVEDRAFT_85401 [Aspergillus versicolor CBS 583.65]|uniref:Uncharacterized protein n=1 Tax=Aspergillus versicolor CBS 583.65 TaxID=1036611 RepID=A0A1L9PR51_ASPVE|nr:uncharacterized protein ASPVEDRAFT_85401 [Aspergillus versicolor CBS 583.65]OJJ03983.1 hypothetical protein ASPVEDRAFT_85401 [Aspergillus versicolor CBS 583.65]